MPNSPKQSASGVPPLSRDAYAATTHAARCCGLQEARHLGGGALQVPSGGASDKGRLLKEGLHF